MVSEREEGLAALQRGDFQTAAVYLETTIQKDPDDFQAHLYLGGVYHHLERYANAVRVLTAATTLQPTSAQARLNLGIAQEQNGELEAARASFQQALRLLPDYPQALEALQRLKGRLQGPAGPGTVATTTPAETATGISTNGPGTSRTSTSMPPDRASNGPTSNGSTVNDLNVNDSNVNGPTATRSRPESVTPTVAPGYAPPASRPPRSTPSYSPQNTEGRPPSLGDYMPPLGFNGPTTAGRTRQPVDMAGNPIEMESPETSGSVPGGTVPRWGTPPGSAPQSPFGQPPFGAQGGPTYGVAGAQQYYVPQTLCNEARTALILSILGSTVGICASPVIHPISLFLALRAKRIIAQNSNLTGDSEATVAVVISGIFTGIWVMFLFLMIIFAIIGAH